MIGTVYKIEIGENIYIGSTIQKLHRRQKDHNVRLNQEKYNNKLYEECRKHNVEKIICNPLKELEIEDDLEIRELEQKYIEELKPSLNHKSAYTTEEDKKKYHKEYYENNIEHYKEYREKNKTNIKEHNKEYREKNKTNIKEKMKEYYEKNKTKMKEYSKEYREKNKAKVLEKVKCEICNSIVNKKNIAKHKKTKKCLSYKTI